MAQTIDYSEHGIRSSWFPHLIGESLGVHLRRILLVSLLLAISAVARADDLTRVTGRVLDSSGAAIRNTPVELRCGSVSREATTSNSGEFAFADVNAQCSITASAAGCAPQTVAAASTVTITLVPLTAQ